MKIKDIQSSVLISLARKQKIANIVLFAVMICTLVWVQRSIDAKEGFFLQGSGSFIYILTGLALVLIWIAMSKANFSKGKGEITIVIDKGNFIQTSNPNSIRLINAYLTVTEKLGLDPKKFTLLSLKSEDTNAFATGLSRNKTVCVYTNIIENSSSESLEAVIAHEFGHLLNKDLVLATVQASLSCGLGVVGGLLGVIIVYLNWGFVAAMEYYALTGVIIPLITNYSSRTKEQFADLFAAEYGFGKGLCIFLASLPVKKPMLFGDLFLNHPAPKNRVKNILNFMVGNDGLVRDSVEHNLWIIAKTLGIIAGAIYLSSKGESLLSFLLASGLFFVSDQLLFLNPGAWYINAKKGVEGLTSDKRVIGVISLVLIALLYFVGLFACIHFLQSEWALLSVLSWLTLIFWVAKPLASFISGKTDNDLLSAISEIATYLATTTSLIMMVSIFVTI